MKWSKVKNALTSAYLMFLIIILGYVSIFTFQSMIDQNSVEAASTWTQTSDHDFNNGTLNNTLINGDGVDAELRLILLELNEWAQKTPGGSGTPVAVILPAMASIYGTDKVLLFGGQDSNYFDHDETWVYDLSENIWTQMTPAIHPGARSGHAMASIHGDDKIVLFGGNALPAPCSNDTWVYDLSEDIWTQKVLSPSATKPDWRRCFAMASIWGTDKVMVFGGGESNYDDTWVYDLSDDIWTEKVLAPSANKPSARRGHAMATIYGTDKVVLFGGNDGSIDDETWIYDFSDDTWTKKTPINHPFPRHFHAMASICGVDEVLLYGGGGQTSANYYSDTWVYDLSENNWAQKYPTNEPSARYCHSMAGIYGTDKVLFFGGGVWPVTYYNDTWVFNRFQPTKNGTYISAAFDTGSNSIFYEINWTAAVPLGTSLKFQLKTGISESDLTSKEFVGLDGNRSTFYTSSPADIWFGHNGEKWVQYKVYFNIPNYPISPTLKNVTISYNCLPNTIVIAPTNGSLLTNNKPIFIWTFEDFDSEEQKAFQVLIDNDTTFEDVNYDSGEQTTIEHRWAFPSGTDYSILPEGAWYWKIRTMDDDGTWTDFSSPRMLTIDSKAPSSETTLPVNNGFYKSLNTISGIAIDPLPGSGINNIEIVIRRLSDNNYWDGADWVPLKTRLSTTGTYVWTYDSSMITWISGINYSVKYKATDNATNVEFPDNEIIFSVDMDRPLSIIDFPTNNTWSNKVDIISIRSMDIGGSGVETVEICIKCIKDYTKGDDGAKQNDYWDGLKWDSEEQWLTISGIAGTNQWFYNTSIIPWTTGNHYTISSRAIDNALNLEVPSQIIKFMYDAVPPEELDIHINFGDEYTNATNIILSLQAKDANSGVSQMSFINDNTEWSDWEIFNTTRLFELSIEEGKKAIYFQVRDYAGNVAGSIFDTIVLDITPPEELSIIINENSKYTNSNDLKLDLKATDRLSGINDISFSYDEFNWLPWESVKQIKYISLPSNGSDSERIVYFRVRDNAGNIALTNDTITLDTTPPYSLSILAKKIDSDKNSQSFELSLQAHDNLSGVYQMSFSTDGVNWDDWENYNSVKYYTIPTDLDSKIIYFRVSDLAGNIAEPISTKLPETNKIQPEKSSFFSEAGNILFLIIFIIILIIIAFVIFVILHKKRSEQARERAIPDETITIKPSTVRKTMISVDEHSDITTTSQLTESSVVSRTQLPTPTLSPSKVPALASISKTDQVPNTQQISQPTPLPQLPPAQAQLVQPVQPIQPIQETKTSEQTTLEVSQTDRHYPCSTCGEQLTFYSQNSKYYCHQCQKYE